MSLRNMSLRLPLLLLVSLAACGDGPPPDPEGGETGGVGVSEDALATGTGLEGRYFTGESFDTLKLERVDGQVSFDWDRASPSPALPADGFSVRWTGQVEAPVTGTYTFTTTSDDGVRLKIQARTVVENWTQHGPTSNSGTISLSAGKRYDLTLEYYERAGGAVIELAWAYPGQVRQVVPRSRLYPQAAPVQTGVRVSGNKLLKNGKVWQPRGLSMVGSLTQGAAVEAYAHWGEAELAAAKAWGADSLRFQVAQPYLDPRGGQDTAAYVARLRSMIDLARSRGFVMVLSMQDQSLAGGDATPLQDASTERAWRTLAPLYANDPYVIYELFNEPDNQATPAGWSTWKNGGDGYVGHQQLVNLLRSLGAKNVLLADGAQKSGVLTGLPLLADPLNQLGYATHPYYIGAVRSDPNAWEKRFGYLAATHVVVSTEWNAHGRRGGCAPDDPVLARRLMVYLESKNIGMYGWAFDWPGTLVQDWSWAPSTFDRWTCGSAKNGAGELLQEFFARP